MKKLFFVSMLVVSGFVQAGGGSVSNPPVHCQMILDEECHSSTAGMVCRPVFRNVCLPVRSAPINIKDPLVVDENITLEE